jgi:hypothetical protein
MNFLKKLGLVEDDAPKEVSKTKPAPQMQMAQAATAGVGVAMAAQGVLDVPSITADIEGDIHNSPAYELYKKFEAQLESLAKVPGMDEATKFRAAQATLGAATEDLIAALESHAIVLANSAQRFEAEFVATSKNEIESLKGKIDAAELKIQQLTADLGAASQDKVDLVTAVQQKTVDLSKADIDFKGIVTTLSTKYSDASKKVQLYLGVANAK